MQASIASVVCRLGGRLGSFPIPSNLLEKVENRVLTDFYFAGESSHVTYAAVPLSLAAPGSGASARPAPFPSPEPPGERMVVLRPDVLDTVGHVLGNLFQRLYHLVDRAGESDALTAEELRGNAARLEAVLQLFLDYVSPVAPNLQPIEFAEIGQSLAQRLTEACGGRLRVHVSEAPSGSVLVDPGRLGRAFDLLASWLQPRSGLESVTPIMVSIAPSGRSLELLVSLSSTYLASRSSEAELRWALAEKLIDLHGGTLTEPVRTAGETQWRITLPLQG
jgi:hypothetical protein